MKGGGGFLQQREVAQRGRQASYELVAREGEVLEVGEIEPDVLWDDAVPARLGVGLRVGFGFGFGFGFGLGFRFGLGLGLGLELGLDLLLQLVHLCLALVEQLLRRA